MGAHGYEVSRGRGRAHFPGWPLSPSFSHHPTPCPSPFPSGSQPGQVSRQLGQPSPFCRSEQPRQGAGAPLQHPQLPGGPQHLGVLRAQALMCRPAAEPGLLWKVTYGTLLESADLHVTRVLTSRGDSLPNSRTHLPLQPRLCAGCFTLGSPPLLNAHDH